MPDKQPIREVDEDDLNAKAVSARQSEWSDELTPLEKEMKLRWLDRLSYVALGSPLVYLPIHYSLKRAGIRRSLYIPFAAGTTFLAVSFVSLKFTYDFMNECLALPPSEYASSAELHFSLKKLGLVYIREDGKLKYTILDPSEKYVTREDTQAIDLSSPPPPKSAENANQPDEVRHIDASSRRSIPKDVLAEGVSTGTSSLSHNRKNESTLVG